MTSPLLVTSAILSPTQFRGRLGDALLDAIEAFLEGTDPAYAPYRRTLRRSKDDLLSASEVNLLYPPTRAGVAGLVALGLCTQAHADVVLAVPVEDIPPDVSAPTGTVAATWNGWPVWAVQVPAGAAWMAQTPHGDVELTHPDFLLTTQMGGAQYRGRSTEVKLT